MKLFSEIYNVYFQVLKKLLQEQDGITKEELRTAISMDGFEESPLYILPKLYSGEWNLFSKEGELFISRLSDGFYVPLSDLQKAYIKTLLNDKRMQLFLDETQMEEMDALLGNISPLWEEEDFYYYDRFTNSDDYSDTAYREHFRILLSAIEHSQPVDIVYRSKTGRRVHHHYVPGRLEYSIKNDKFRLLSAKDTKSGYRLVTLNLDRIEDVAILSSETKSIDMNALIQNSYYKEPAHLLIHNERNALERTMLHFANYEKNTNKLADDLYECFIYYNMSMETELLIEVMSFGPMIEVVGSERFLGQLKERLRKQMQFDLMAPEVL